MSLSNQQIEGIVATPHTMRNIHQAEEVQQIVQYMIEYDTRPSACVQVAMYSLWADSILRGLRDRYRGTDQMGEFASAVASIHFELIGSKYPITWNLVRELLSNTEALINLIDSNMVSIREDHPILKRLEWDLYWEFQFKRFHARRNFKRTWDVIRRARIGFLLDDLVPAGHSLVDYDACTDPAYRAFPASAELVATMTRRLFTSMVTAEVLEPIRPGDPRPDWDSLHSRIPGIDLARQLLSVCTETAHQSLIIATHFSRTRNGQKRTKLLREIARS